jgi:hypothetical protein
MPTNSTSPASEYSSDSETFGYAGFHIWFDILPACVSDYVGDEAETGIFIEDFVPHVGCLAEVGEMLATR